MLSRTGTVPELRQRRRRLRAGRRRGRRAAEAAVGRRHRDGDGIHAVIRGTAINHGGKTNGYTVPNPQAQATLIATALRRRACHPRGISYVEAHGTGTALGDPIEVAGLTQAFGGYQRAALRAGLGEIEHRAPRSGGRDRGLTSPAADAASQLVPSLHAQARIRTSTSPRRRSTFNGRRRNGLNRGARQSARSAPAAPMRTSFSSRTKRPDRTRALTGRMMTPPARIPLPGYSSSPRGLPSRSTRRPGGCAISSIRIPSLSASQVAYTLQTGREAFVERLAVVAGSRRATQLGPFDGPRWWVRSFELSGQQELDDRCDRRPRASPRTGACVGGRPYRGLARPLPEWPARPCVASDIRVYGQALLARDSCRDRSRGASSADRPEYLHTPPAALQQDVHGTRVLSGGSRGWRKEAAARRCLPGDGSRGGHGGGRARCACGCRV